MENATELRLGQVITFDYPAANYHGITPRYEQRRLLIQRLRYCDREPLDPITFRMNPLLKRGRTLVIGIDLDKGEQRSFWDASMRDLEVIHLEPTTSVMESSYGTSFSVAVIDNIGKWDPDDELPDEFRIVHVMVHGVAECFAHTIADKANLDAIAMGIGDRRAIVLPPGFLSQT